MSHYRYTRSCLSPWCERGSIDTERELRGFVLEFYTEEGMWGIVGNNTPVGFIRDQLKSTFGRFLPVTKGRFWPIAAIDMDCSWRR